MYANITIADTNIEVHYADGIAVHAKYESHHSGFDL